MIIGPQIYATIADRWTGGLSLSRPVQYCRSPGLMNMQCLIAMGKLQARLARLIWLINGHNESNYQLLTALNCGTLSKVSRASVGFNRPVAILQLQTFQCIAMVLRWNKSERRKIIGSDAKGDHNQNRRGDLSG